MKIILSSMERLSSDLTRIVPSRVLLSVCISMGKLCWSEDNIVAAGRVTVISCLLLPAASDEVVRRSITI
jgi:hypothetical protein